MGRPALEDKLSALGFADVRAEAIDALFALLDWDGDGEISYNDFNRSILTDVNFGRTRNLPDSLFQAPKRKGSDWQRASWAAGPGRFVTSNDRRPSLLTPAQQAQQEELNESIARNTAGRRRQGSATQKRRQSAWSRTITPGPFHGRYDPPAVRSQRVLSPMAQQSRFHEEQEIAEKARLNAEAEWERSMQRRWELRTHGRQQAEPANKQSSVDAKEDSFENAHIVTNPQASLQSLYSKLYGTKATSGGGHLRNRIFLNGMP
jgi:hypothetical protein